MFIFLTNFYYGLKAPIFAKLPVKVMPLVKVGPDCKPNTQVLPAIKLHVAV